VEIPKTAFDSLNGTIERIFVYSNQLWLYGYAGAFSQNYHFPGRYYASDGKLFDADGDRVVGIHGAHKITYDPTERFYPATGRTVKIAPGFTDVGLAGGRLHFFGEPIDGSAGEGYYIHRGHLYNSDGNKIIKVQKRANGTFLVTNQGRWF
jgi:hypothetical protein